MRLRNQRNSILYDLASQLEPKEIPPRQFVVKPSGGDRLYSVLDNQVELYLHEGQRKAWESEKRFTFMLAGTQGGKTSFVPWWLAREIQRQGAGDYIAATATYDLFQLKLLPEMRRVFENELDIGRYWAGAGIFEIRNPETGMFQATSATDPNMWARIILRAASSEGGLESTTAKAAILDEVGQDRFGLGAWEAVLRRLSLSRGRVLGATTIYNLGWLKQKIYDEFKRGDETIDVIQFSSKVNPAFPDEEFEDVEKKIAAWKFNMFYKGEFDRPAGMIYSDFVDALREEGGHLVRPFDIPDWWPRYVAVDPGANNTAMLWVAFDPDSGFYYVYRETLEGDKSTSEHARGAQRSAEKNNEHVIWYAVGQKSEKQYRLDWRAAGVHNVVEPPFSDVEAGIDKVIELLRMHRIYFLNNLSGTLDQMLTYARVMDSDDEPTDKIESKEKYHYLDALRYFAVQVTGRNKMRIRPQPALLANYRG